MCIFRINRAHAIRWHCARRACAWRAHGVRTIKAAHDVRTSCAKVGLRTACARYAHGMRMACAHHAHNMRANVTLAPLTPSSLGCRLWRLVSRLAQTGKVKTEELFFNRGHDFMTCSIVLHCACEIGLLGAVHSIARVLDRL